MGKSVVKVVNPCVCSTYYGKANAYAKIEYEGGKLSICGVVGPKRNGDCIQRLNRHGYKEDFMNRQRRKRLTEAFGKVAEAMEILEEVKSEEEESYDNLPDNFRDGDRGEEMQNYIEMLDEAYGYLDDANSVIEQI